MIVLVIETASEKLRGELTRWFMEAKPGIFVGNASKVVRDILWKKICEDKVRKGALLFSAVIRNRDL